MPSNMGLWSGLALCIEEAQEILLPKPGRGKEVPALCLYSPSAQAFIWGPEGRGEPEAKEFFETRSSYILDKLKEMLLYRAESNLMECFLYSKAKRAKNINGLKNISDIVINYVYENNLNNQQYGNS